MKGSLASLAILIMVSSLSHSSAGADSGPSIGTVAPAFEASGVDGTRIASADLARSGKPTVIVFWGLRCGACLEEIPACNNIYAKYKGKIALLGVNVDGIDAELLFGQIKKKEIRIDYTVVADPDLKMADLFGMTMAPLTVVLDRKGVVRYRHENFTVGDEKQLDELLYSLLGETP